MRPGPGVGQAVRARQGRARNLTTLDNCDSETFDPRLAVIGALVNLTLPVQ